jgi:hypothetical protein
LGISFYTKLLFFFRAESNSYILDQWTAKSAHLLFEPPPVGLSTFGLPDPDTSPESYESFCADLERLGSPWGWTGEDVERAIFDRRGGCWRSQVQSAFPDLPRGVRSQRQRQVSIQVGKSSRQYLLGNKIIAVHHSALQDEVTLPGDELCIGDYSPYRIVCSSVGGISWQYNIQKSCVRVDVFFPKQYVPRYDAIRKAAGIQGHDFGDGIVGNGADQGKTRSIATMVDRGANAHDSELKSIAEASVEAMNRLYERIAPLL